MRAYARTSAYSRQDIIMNLPRNFLHIFLCRPLGLKPSLPGRTHRYFNHFPYSQAPGRTPAQWCIAFARITCCSNVILSTSRQMDFQRSMQMTFQMQMRIRCQGHGYVCIFTRTSSDTGPTLDQTRPHVARRFLAGSPCMPPITMQIRPVQRSALSGPRTPLARRNHAVSNAYALLIVEAWM